MLSKNVCDDYIKPAKIYGNLYFIGIRAVCTHLIDTGDGLIIIDPGYSESLYMIINNIWELGFKPTDIKYIVISHAHHDHFDSVKALVAMSGAKTFIGKDDLPLLSGKLYRPSTNSFVPDVLLSDGDVISLGNTNIKCISTPGHTDGTMSFFFDVTDGTNTYRAGMFGGAGTNTLKKDFLEKNNLPFENRQKFIDSINKIKDEKVELFLGNHLENNRTEEKLAMLESSDKNPFIANSQEEWNDFLERRLKLINNIIRENL